MENKLKDDRRRYSLQTIVLFMVGAALLVLLGVAIQKNEEATEQVDRGRSNLDKITDVVRENRNRIEVSSLKGNVTTVRETSGGIFGWFEGKLVIRQPFSVGYFVEMRNMSLSDYIWDEGSRTLFVRLPAVTVDPPNIDASRQQVASKGWVITQDMQQRLRKSVAVGAREQAKSEAAKPENMEAARAAAKLAISRNLALPLRAAGVRNIHVEVIDPKGGTGERWDVSRSIGEVLADLANARK